MKIESPNISIACQKFLPALARMLLRSGLNCRQFIELAKIAYVSVVTEDFGRSGRPTNVSRTAMLTGLTRVSVRTVRKALSLPNSVPSSDGRFYSLTALLKDWHHEPVFLSADGQPLTLSLNDGTPTFSDLVRRHFGDVSAKTVLKELLDAGSVATDDEKRITVLRDYYLLPPVPDQQAARAGELLSDFIQTVDHNMNRTSDVAPRFESRTSYSQVPINRKEEFYALLEKEALGMSTRLYDWLREQHASEPDASTVRMGLGIYQIHGGNSGESQTTEDAT